MYVHKITKLAILLFSSCALCSCLHTTQKGDTFKVEAEKGNARAQFELAKKYQSNNVEEYEGYWDKVLLKKEEISQRNHQMAMKWFEESAKNGNNDAMFELGDIYDPSYSGYYNNKKYIKKDMKKALEWYTRAASYGNKKALDRLGEKYNTNYELFTKRRLSCKEEIASKKKAMDYYRQAGSSGAGAAYSLAEIYMNGREDCKKDINQAIKYYEFVLHDSIYGDDASKALANYFFEMKQYEKALNFYLTFFQNKGDYMNYGQIIRNEIATMEFKIAYIYENGLGVPKDSAKAIYYYSRAANKGLVEAQQNLRVLQNTMGSFRL